ncbi:M56 family metallopeptidase [Paramicrobacterium fandaimingii]|uniref:M56 family metallopeptidase n=1 Tax=Paramicrobacterium fandaimingii TaxID=2708079 RepID=UPI00142344B6|nr:M56 family metallopeptidase [Microbacterium fandaimingii]
MVVASALLAALAFALAWPVPIVLARADWPSRAPAIALVVWQAIAIAGVLSTIGAFGTFGLSGIASTVSDGLVILASAAMDGSTPSGLGTAHIFALCCAVLFAGHLLLSVLTTIVRTERERRRQHDLVTLLSTPTSSIPGTRLLEYAAPVAYCLPGAFRTATVLTDGLVKALSTDEVNAVISHERAHLAQQHHLLLLAFRAWRKALPWFPIATRASDAVGLLVEMRADDTARAEYSADSLVSAIITVATGGGGSPDVGVADATPQSAAPRVTRLLTQPHPLPSFAVVGILGASLALVLVPPLLLLTA